MKKIRVLNMVYSLGSGGIERFSVECYRHINCQLIEMDFVTKRNKSEFYDEDIKKLGGRKISLSNTAVVKGFSAKIQMLVKAIKLFNDGYNVAYFNISSPADAIKYPLLSRIAGIKKTVVHAHSSLDSKRGLIHSIANSIGRLYLSNSTIKKVACSESAALWMFGEKTCKDRHYTEIKNGIDIDLYRFNPHTRNEYRKQLGISESTLVVGQVGRFVALKNHDFTLQVAKELIEKNIDCYFVFAGDGRLKSDCEKLAKKMGISDRILFLGNRKDVGGLLQSFDIFVMPSEYEGLPLAAIEAQTSGCRCVFSNGITKETDVTGNCTFLPLEKEYWVKEIMSFAPSDRNESAERVASAGYDINDTARTIENILLQ